jgi:hypothetical protein
MYVGSRAQGSDLSKGTDQHGCHRRVQAAGLGTVQNTTRQHVDPNVVFPFQDDFSVGTIHGANTKTVTPNVNEVVEIQDNSDNESILTAKTAGDTQSKVVVGSRVASGPNPVSDPTADSTQPGAASGGSEDPASVGPAGGAIGGPIGK